MKSRVKTHPFSDIIKYRSNMPHVRNGEYRVEYFALPAVLGAHGRQKARAKDNFIPAARTQ